MPFHHVALATNDLDATHRFYTEAMGFTLAKTVVAPTDGPGGWAKHLFYDTGGQGLIAFWELHDPTIGDFDPAMSTSQGLPIWTNHLAFHATDQVDLEARKQHWLDTGHDVVEVDHGFCVSIYTTDPNGTMVEWCMDTRALDEDDAREAEALLADADPPLSDAPVPVIHRAPVPAS